MQGLTSSKYRNSVLALDEFDRVANDAQGASTLNMLLPLLEPSTQFIFDAYVGENVDISHQFFILAGNNPLKDPALLNRCTIIKLQGLDKDVKIHGIKKHMLPLLLDSDIPSLSLLALPREVRERVEAAIADDQDPGFRSVQKKLISILNKVRLGKQD